MKTGRREHLRFNNIVSRGLSLGLIVILISLIHIFYENNRLDLIKPWWITALLFSPIQFSIHERWAGPDMDIPTRKGFLGIYWRIYAKNVRHRGMFSHTLVFGTFVRFLIGYWFVILGLLAIFNLDVLLVQPVILGDLRLPNEVGYMILCWYGSCVLSDLAHILCDLILNPIKILFLGDA